MQAVRLLRAAARARAVQAVRVAGHGALEVSLRHARQPVSTFGIRSGLTGAAQCQQPERPEVQLHSRSMMRPNTKLRNVRSSMHELPPMLAGMAAACCGYQMAGGAA